MKMLSGFREFIMRGNVVDLAVGIVIGSAFAGVVDGLLDGLINPLIAFLFGEPDISGVWTFTPNGTTFSVGIFLNALLNFLIVAAALYFIVVLPMNKLAEARKAKDEPVEEELEAGVALLTEIRDLLALQNR